ncbi:ABC transporter permease subunit, partial [Actinotignum schaalii]|uniref:ABC transporter permease subunit n=1 Tax=Actinotignum schaalii TaxID=59505 RepID=UPI00254AA8D6
IRNNRDEWRGRRFARDALDARKALDTRDAFDTRDARDHRPAGKDIVFVIAVIIFLAGMQGIPTELVEAARVDGASYWQIQRRITIPLL